jgi:hypothetical protein
MYYYSETMIIKYANRAGLPAFSSCYVFDCKLVEQLLFTFGLFFDENVEGCQFKACYVFDHWKCCFEYCFDAPD